jgi:hypothetical protein
VDAPLPGPWSLGTLANRTLVGSDTARPLPSTGSPPTEAPEPRRACTGGGRGGMLPWGRGGRSLPSSPPPPPPPPLSPARLKRRVGVVPPTGGRAARVAAPPSSETPESDLPLARPPPSLPPVLPPPTLPRRAGVGLPTGGAAPEASSDNVELVLSLPTAMPGPHSAVLSPLNLRGGKATLDCRRSSEGSDTETASAEAARLRGDDGLANTPLPLPLPSVGASVGRGPHAPPPTPAGPGFELARGRPPALHGPDARLPPSGSTPAALELIRLPGAGRVVDLAALPERSEQSEPVRDRWLLRSAPVSPGPNTPWPSTHGRP